MNGDFAMASRADIRDLKIFGPGHGATVNADLGPDLETFGVLCLIEVEE